MKQIHCAKFNRNIIFVASTVFNWWRTPFAQTPLTIRNIRQSANDDSFMPEREKPIIKIYSIRAVISIHARHFSLISIALGLFGLEMNGGARVLE